MTRFKRSNGWGKTAIITMLLLLPFRLAAQELIIKQFVQANEFIANADRIKDWSDELCSIVKIQGAEIDSVAGSFDVKTRGAELWVYVTRGTRRLTIYKKGFEPLKAEFRDYGFEKGADANRVYRITIIEKLPETETKRSAYFNLGAGFNAVGMMGPTVFIGFEFGGHVVEAGATIGISKATDITIYQTDNATYWGTYDYSAMRFFLCYGYNVEASPSLLITPMIGAAINNISGSEVKRSNAGDLFGKVNTVSASVGCRLSYCIGSTVRIYAMPEFAFGVKKDKSFDVLKEADSKIKSWGEGVGLSAGLMLHF